MDALRNHAFEAMNWADYWDSLADEYFKLRENSESQPSLLQNANATAPDTVIGDKPQ